MSALLLPALAAGSSGQGALYVDDVFSTYLYTGNGSAQTVNNGIDLAGNGGLVWLKNRTSAGNHYLFDTVRGALNELNSNNTESSASLVGSLTAFLSNGFSLGNSADVNQSGQNYASWTFRRAPKFLDIVTWTGNYNSPRNIAHDLGASPGLIIARRVNGSGLWHVKHRVFAAQQMIYLNSSGGHQNGVTSGILDVTPTHFQIGSDLNQGGTYIAYVFGHDTGVDGLIQCGAVNGSSGGPVSVNLGFEPQFVLLKAAYDTGDWHIFDNMRGMSMGNDARLFANLSQAEDAASNPIDLTSTGFVFRQSQMQGATTASTKFIYLAIRRPNKPPTSGAQVYNASTVSGVVSAEFPVDLHIGATRTGEASNHAMHARLTSGTRELVTSGTAVEATITDIGFDSMTGLKASLPSGMVNHFFRRAAGFMDVVCDTGTGVAHAIAHNLTKAPELIIRKSCSAATQWEVWHSALAADEKLVLNSNAAKAIDATAWSSTLPTATQFTVGTGPNVNANAATFVTYLFATLAGISKVGSYTGNGGNQAIDCGFSTGARFALIKRTDATGDWYVWDTARGIVAANDPHLSLNTTAAEVTMDDSIDPASVGFIVNQNAVTNVNVTGANYIFLAIA